MRFSTRRFHAASIFRILAPAVAILVLGFIVSQSIQKGASAEEANNGKIYYYSATDAAELASEVQRSEQAVVLAVFGEDMTMCATPGSTEGLQYYVGATNADLCDDYDLSADNAIQIQKYGYTYLDENRSFDNTALGQSRQTGTDGSNPLGYLGAFHMIAFEKLDAQEQVYGNIAAGELHASSNNNINHFTIPTLSYAEVIDDNVRLSSFTPNNEGNDTTILVVGSAAESQVGFTAPEGGRTWTINGEDRKINDSKRIGDNQKIFLDNIWVDKDDLFLSLDSLEAKAITENKYLTTLDTTIPEDSYDLETLNQQFINLPDNSGLNVLNLDYSDLPSVASDIRVYGYTAEDDGQGGRQNIPATLLINVDLKDVPVNQETGKKSYNQSAGFKVCYKSQDDFADPDSVEGGGDEWCLYQKYIHDRFEHHIIINYYDSSDPDGLYRGEIHLVSPKATTQFTLAPEADVYTHGTPYQGVIIATNIDLDGDTHYLSLHDLQPLRKRDEMCSLVVHHVNYTTGATIRDDEAVPYVCGEIAEVGHAADLINQGYVPVLNNGGEMPVPDETIPIGVVENPTEATVYYKTRCKVTIAHRHADTGALLTVDGNNPIEYVDYCGEFQVTVDVARELLTDYDFVEGYEVESDDHYRNLSDFPLSTDIVESDLDYIIEYREKPVPEICEIHVHHYIWGTTTSIDADVDASGYCNSVRMPVGISENALNQGYSYYIGKIESDTQIIEGDIPASSFPITVDNDIPVKIVTLYYAIEPGPEFCHYEVHHWNEDGSKELADAEYYDDVRCDNILKTIDKSSALVNDGYSVIKAHFDNEDEDIELPYDFSPSHPDTDYVFNIYYKKTGTPDTATGKATSIAFTVAGASIALGAVLFTRARRQ